MPVVFLSAGTVAWRWLLLSLVAPLLWLVVVLNAVLFLASVILLNGCTIFAHVGRGDWRRGVRGFEVRRGQGSRQGFAAGSMRRPRLGLEHGRRWRHALSAHALPAACNHLCVRVSVFMLHACVLAARSVPQVATGCGLRLFRTWRAARRVRTCTALCRSVPPAPCSVCKACAVRLPSPPIRTC